MLHSKLTINGVTQKRVFSFVVSRPGGFMNGPGDITFSNMNIGAICLRLFWDWFGLRPTTFWHQKGFMAEAWDKRGNWIQITQINYGDPKLPEFYKRIKYLKAS